MFDIMQVTAVDQTVTECRITFGSFSERLAVSLRCMSSNAVVHGGCFALLYNHTVDNGEKLGHA